MAMTDSMAVMMSAMACIGPAAMVMSALEKNCGCWARICSKMVFMDLP